MEGFFPSFTRATGFTIGRQGVLSLTGWSPSIHTGFHVSGATQVPADVILSSPTGLSPSTVSTFQSASAEIGTVTNAGPTTPSGRARWFRLIPVRSPLLRESLLLSFPPGTEMFQFSGLATCTYEFSTCQFGYLGIRARLTASPRLSQSSTPFNASWRQDIPHTPLVAWPH